MTTQTKLPGVVVIKPKRFTDGRGFFSESWNSNTLTKQGINTTFVQENQSLSRTVGTIRGLHYQSPPARAG